MLRTRIQTGLVLAVIVGVSILWFDTWLAALVFGVFWTIGAFEWSRLAGLRGPAIYLYTGVIAAFCLAVIVFGAPEPGSGIALWLAVAGWALTAVLILRFPRPLPAWLILVIGLVVLPGAWLAFYVLHEARPGLILAGLIMVWSADTGAYFVGRSIGRTPLAPRVSPKKTWEGVAGGLAAAALAGAIAAVVLDLSVPLLALLAVVAALVSICGDLGISMFKRRAGVKDSGVLLPGHGGVLDRFDGVTAALPVIALGLQFAHVLD